MPATEIDVDDEALNEAVRLSGARTRSEAVNLALRDYIGRRRAEARLRHFQAGQNWDEEGFLRQHTAEKGTS